MGTPVVAFAKHQRRHSVGAYYPLTLAFSYTAYSNGHVVQRGTGESIEISSSGVRVKTAESVDASVNQMRLSIAWPVALDDGTKLQLVVQGPVARAHATLMEVTFWQYEFRTVARRAANVEASMHTGPFLLPRESQNASSGASLAG